MKKLVIVLFSLVALSLVVSGCGCKKSECTKDASSQKEACENCTKGQQGEDAWCDKCSKGFVDGKATKCKGCVDAAKAGTKCEKCAGACTKCEGECKCDKAKCTKCEGECNCAKDKADCKCEGECKCDKDKADCKCEGECKCDKAHKCEGCVEAKKNGTKCEKCSAKKDGDSHAGHNH